MGCSSSANINEQIEDKKKIKLNINGDVIFGIDLGDVNIAKFGLFINNGTLCDKWACKINPKGTPDELLIELKEQIFKKLAEKEININELIGIGVGVPGAVDSNGLVYPIKSLNWETPFNLNEKFSKILEGIAVVSCNDATAAALGEMWMGVARGHRNLVEVTLGHGVGCGIIAQGNIIYGHNGASGEIGHCHINDEETVPCYCGNYGCIEQYTGVPALLKKCRAKIDEGKLKTTLVNDSRLKASMIWEAADEGDELAEEVMNEYGNNVAKALAIICNLFNNNIFVICGEMSNAGGILLKYIKKNYKSYAFSEGKNAELLIGTLGEDAGIYGAAKLVIPDKNLK
jgi:glucokinase